jgi:hypothetical protein
MPSELGKTPPESAEVRSQPGETPSSLDQEDELLQGIYQPDLAATLEGVESRTFKPWHKPRKQYIRIYQWCAIVRRLIKQNGMQRGDILRYLGQPGEDLLDIRSLYGVCKPGGILLKYLGFDSTAKCPKGEFEFQLAQHEVAQLGFINQHSRILRARIEQVANEASLAYKYTREYGDFDVINIDLCDSLAGPVSLGKGPYFEAIKKLCQLQLAGRTRPWVMFVATRAGKEQLDDDLKFKLLNCLLGNINESAEFASKLREQLQIDDGAIQGEMSNSAPLTHELLVQVFGLSLGKWLIRLMMSGTPSVAVQLLNSYSYRVYGDEPDMLSLAFLFEPIIVHPVDRSGLTSPEARVSQGPTEIAQAVRFLLAVVGIEDVDKKLLGDRELHRKMIDKCGTLLEEAHYDKNSYQAWAVEASWRSGRQPPAA